jgi:peptidoglycan/LPS O-acetylase OafA/YrhL
VVFYHASWLPAHNESGKWLFYAWFCLALPYLFALTRNNARDSRVGDLSYPVYVVHLLVVSMLAPLVLRLGLDAFNGELAVATSLIAAFALVKLVSDPLEHYRQSRVGTLSFA